MILLKNFLLVGVGGAAGSMARYGVSFLFNKWITTTLPLATFTINITGSLLIGILFGLMTRNHWMQTVGLLLLASGFCGGFTTFSTFALENVTIMQKGQSMTAIIYMALSVIAGLLVCRAGMWLTGA